MIPPGSRPPLAPGAAIRRLRPQLLPRCIGFVARRHGDAVEPGSRHAGILVAMQALVFEGPWEMPLRERAAPEPGEGEVVVAVRASGICGSDVHGYAGITGRRTPGVVMGHEAAGVVEAVGPGVDDLSLGDRVALRSILPCFRCQACRAGRTNVCEHRRGLGMHIDGAYADLVRLPATAVLPLPDAVSFEEAAMIEPLAVAMHAVNLTPVDLFDPVVIIGSGTIGLLTLLAARARGAGHVIMTDRSAHRLDLARTLGADDVLDASAGDPVAAILERTGGRGAPVVFEAVGATATVRQSTAVARRGGHVTWIGNSAPVVELAMQELVSKELTLHGAYGFVDEFERAARALATRRLDVRALIERVAPLREGPDLFRALARAELDAVKVILTP
jgi:L-iditol 2-dehydrogenase